MTGNPGGAECGGFEYLRPIYGCIEHVGQELHRPVACNHTAIDAQDGVAGCPPIGTQGFQQVTRLKANGLQCRA